MLGLAKPRLLLAPASNEHVKERVRHLDIRLEEGIERHLRYRDEFNIDERTSRCAARLAREQGHLADDDPGARDRDTDGLFS